MNAFLQRLADPRPILLDGAIGTELERRGVDTSTPIWSAMALLDSPKLVEQVHREYLEAGAEVIITNTFRTHRRNLEKIGMGDEAARMTALAVAIAQQAVRASGKVAFVAGSMSPLEDSYSANALPPEVYLAEHTEMARNLSAAGVDLLLIETISTIREAQAAAQAAKATGLPHGVCFICKTDGRMFSGESLADAVEAVEKHSPTSWASIAPPPPPCTLRWQTCAPPHRCPWPPMPIPAILRIINIGARPKPLSPMSTPNMPSVGSRAAPTWWVAAAARGQPTSPPFASSKLSPNNRIVRKRSFHPDLQN